MSPFRLRIRKNINHWQSENTLGTLPGSYCPELRVSSHSGIPMSDGKTIKFENKLDFGVLFSLTHFVQQ